jgi:hypothetical protein
MEGTATPQATPSPTVTPVIYLSGESEIASGDQFDLDSGDLNPEDTKLFDFFYTFGGTPAYLLTNANEMQWVVFGQGEPSYAECLDAERVDEPLGFTEVPFGTYICYQTSESLHGWLLINGIIDDRLVIRFQTWALP